MHTYETLFITPPNLGEDDEKVIVDTMANVVAEGGGTMIANDRMGRRRLAYPIKKFEDGVYVRFLYDAAIEVPKELERRIRLHENVLRSLTVRLTPEWAVDAKEEAVREAQRRVEAEKAEIERLAAEAEAARLAAEAGPAEGEDEAATEAAAESEAAPATSSAETPAPATEPAAEVASESTEATKPVEGKE